MKARLKIFFWLVIIVGLAVVVGNYFQNKIEVLVKKQVVIKVIRIIDGDTVEITGGKIIRYIGVDTPETKDPRRPVGCFGKEATQKNTELVLNKEITLEKDVSETDKYGRLLRYVWVDGVMINQQLVKEGYARVATYPPDVKYSQLFLKSEKEARVNSLGLWNKCP